MNTRLTLADARAALYTEICPDDANDPKVAQVINEVLERFILDGGWKGNIIEVTFDSPQGFITLPFNYMAVLALTYNKCPVPMFTQFHKFIENGPGDVDKANAWPGVLIDLGDGFVTQTDLPEGASGFVRLYSSATDNGDVCRVYGKYNGVTVYDSVGNEGEQVILAAPFASTTNVFSEITGFMKPAGANRVRLKVWDGVAETQLAEYEPNETRPSYHRYQTGNADKVIKAICRRRFVPVLAETDWVIPGNMSALRAGVRSWLFENASDMDAADQSMARAIAFLNNEAKTSRGGGRPTINVELWSCGTPPIITVN